MVDHLLTPQEAPGILRAPVSFVCERTRFDSMPGMVRIGKYVRISESALRAFIEQGGEMNVDRRHP